jgi:hypothetical protein
MGERAGVWTVPVLTDVTDREPSASPNCEPECVVDSPGDSRGVLAA